jgi:acyl-CoA synthetase (AMP-forming)/AMP-acid ligase II
MEVTQSLHQAVQQRPDALMTLFGHRRRTVSESASRIARLATALVALGVGAGDRVAYLGLNSDHYHEYLYACPWAGAVANPVNIRWSAAEIAYSLRDSETATLIVDDAFAALVPAIQECGVQLTTLIYAGERDCPAGMIGIEELIEAHAESEDVRRGGAEMYGIFYTGGTTGYPKGVMLSHDNVVTAALGNLATAEFLTRSGRLLHVAPMFHLADIGTWIAGNLCGTTHVISPGFSAEGTAALIAQHGVNDVLLVPTMIQLMVDEPSIMSYDLSSVRHVIYGASPIAETLLDRVRWLFPDAGFCQGYGMTELAPTISMLGPGEHFVPGLRRSAGRPAPHVEVRIVNEHDLEVPRGEVGEVAVRSDSVMLGYWRQPEATQAALRGGWMHTGDLATMDENGYLYVVDRLKDMIITGGENVYSSEVENALSAHPAVSAAAVIGLPDPQWGESVHAVVVLGPSEHVSEAALREHCRRLIAGYKVPRSIEFVEALPVSAAGKVLKRELRREVA